MAEYLTVAELDSFLRGEQDVLFRYLCALSRDEETAADMLQTVCLKFIQEVRKERIFASTAAHYLKRMARNEYYRHHNRRKNEITRATIDIEDSRQGDADSMEEQETQAQIRTLFLESLSDPELPERTRRVLRLRLLEQRSLPEICSSLDLSRATVYRLMRTGLDALITKFREAGLDPERTITGRRTGALALTLA